MSRLEYRVEAYVDDGYAASPLETLKLRIKDVNEEPEFQTTQWTLTKNDEGGVGMNFIILKMYLLILNADIEHRS